MIQGRRYIDGGIYSAANLDLLAGEDVDTVVCLNPMSSPDRGGVMSPTGRLAAIFRGDNRKTVDREASLLRREGKQVFLLEPTGEDIKAMGFNYMSRRSLDRVAEGGRRTVAQVLRTGELGAWLRGLPPGAGARVRRPDIEPARWPEDLFPPEQRTA
jgi:NTE family protein